MNRPSNIAIGASIGFLIVANALPDLHGAIHSYSAITCALAAIAYALQRKE